MKNSDLKKIVNNHFSSIISQNFKLKQNILYREPFNDLIIGFCFESSPSIKDGVYVWSFVQPLYLKNDSVILTFGKRLGNESWELKNIKNLDKMERLLSLLKNEINSLSMVDTPDKFYNFYKDKCENLRMIEGVVYSAIYTNNQDSELFLDNYIKILKEQNLEIKWINALLIDAEYLKFIFNDPFKIDNFFKDIIKNTIKNLNLY